MRIGFTGTRRGMSEPQRNVVQILLAEFGAEPGSTFHHGDCVGADEQAHRQADAVGLGIFIYPPIDSTHRTHCGLLKLAQGSQIRKIYQPKHYTARNRDIVNSSDIIIAAPREFEEQSFGGTWYTVRYARKAGKRVLIVYPDGIVVEA